MLSIPYYLLFRQGKSLDYVLAYPVVVIVEITKNAGTLRKLTSFRSRRTQQFSGDIMTL
jgi:hypothetical protein